MKTYLAILIAIAWFIFLIITMWFWSGPALGYPDNPTGLSYKWAMLRYYDEVAEVYTDQQVTFSFDEYNRLNIEYINCTPSEGAKIFFDYLIKYWEVYHNNRE